MTRQHLLALALCLGCGGSWACGTCAEDKIAATYDHATAKRAAAAGRVMVYCEVAGAWDAAKLKAAAARVRGLDAATVRLSKEQGAMSFALDAARQSPQAAVLALQVAAPGTRVGIVKVVSASAR
jgi:hypothetical protein